MRTLNQSTSRNVMVFMTDTNDGKTGLTGLTLTCTLSKDGAAFASISPTVTERGNGWYNVALTSSHTDTIGDLALRATATGADSAEVLMQVVDPLTAAEVNAECDSALADVGLTTTITGRIDAAVSTRAVAADLAVTVQPYSSHAPQRANGSTVTGFLGEDGVDITITCYDAAKELLDLTGKTLRYAIALYSAPKTPIFVSDAFTGSGSTFDLTLDSEFTDNVQVDGEALLMTLWEGTEVIQWGRLAIKPAAPLAAIS